MLFTIVENFGPDDGESWLTYLDWRKIKFERFDSLDGILRPSLFEPKTNKDWDYVVQDNFMLSYITDFQYAQERHQDIGSGSLLGFCYSEHNESDEGFLGYDIIDSYCDVSLLTNWGNDEEIINQALSMNGLVKSFSEVDRIHSSLILNYAEDAHVDGCRIVSVYSTEHLK